MSDIGMNQNHVGETMRLNRCGGQTNANQYANGCRCYGCTDAWKERARKRKISDNKRRAGFGSASRGGKEMSYGFTRNDIMKARGYDT